MVRFICFIIMVLVVGSNIKYRWTPNGYVAACVAFLAALLFADLAMKLRGRLLHARDKLRRDKRPRVRIGWGTMDKLV